MSTKRTATSRTKKNTAQRRLLLSPLAKQLLLGSFLLCLLAGVTYGVYTMTRVSKWQVATVAVSGGETVSHEAVEQAAEESLEGEYYALVPKTFVLTVPEDAIRDAVEEIPRVKDVAIEQVGQELRVAFTEYEPYALLCHAETCFFVDETGVVFASAPHLTGRTLLRIEVPDEIVVGSMPLPTERVAWFVNLRDLLHEKFSWSVRSMAFQGDDGVAIFFTESTLYVSAQSTPEKIVSDIEQILASKEFAHLEPENIEYVDMRYGNKVFVKEVGAESATPDDESSTEPSADETEE